MYHITLTSTTVSFMMEFNTITAASNLQGFFYSVDFQLN